MPETTKQREARHEFTRRTDDFTLTVLHEDGEYRHLRFAAPGTRIDSTDIHTWPGGVCTSGDIGDGWVFERGFELFDHGRAPNLHYWQEKLNRNGRDKSEEFSVEALRDSLSSTAEEHGVPEAHHDELNAALRELCDQFAHDNDVPLSVVIDELDSFSFTYEDEEGTDVTVAISDSWELGMTDYNYHFMWACHALHTAARMLREGSLDVRY